MGEGPEETEDDGDGDDHDGEEEAEEGGQGERKKVGEEEEGDVRKKSRFLVNSKQSPTYSQLSLVTQLDLLLSFFWSWTAPTPGSSFQDLIPTAKPMSTAKTVICPSSHSKTGLNHDSNTATLQRLIE